MYDVSVVRPKHFQHPFSREEQDVVIRDRIWFAPQVKETSFQFQGFQDSSLFGREGPIALEYCSGNGAWIAAKAIEYPHLDWLGVEIKWKRIKKIWSKIQNHQLSNLVGVCGEALSWTRRYVPAASIDKVFINFPDPWPKKKHSKYRLINPSFIEEMGRILKPGGEIMVVTDDPNYSASILACLIHSPHFAPELPAPHFSTEWEGYGSSYFEELWRDKGLNIHYILFKRV